MAGRTGGLAPRAGKAPRPPSGVRIGEGLGALDRSHTASLGAGYMAAAKKLPPQTPPAARRDRGPGPSATLRPVDLAPVAQLLADAAAHERAADDARRQAGELLIAAGANRSPWTVQEAADLLGVDPRLIELLCALATARRVEARPPRRPAGIGEPSRMAVVADLGPAA